MKKKIFITIGVVVILIAVVIGIFVAKDFRQEKILREEIAGIQKPTDPEQMDMNEVKEKLGRTVTTGDYAKVEKAVKKYMAYNFNNAITIAEVLNDEVLTNALTVENYASDGPDFVKTKQSLAEMERSLSIGKVEMSRLASDETVMSYLEETEDTYYVDLYKEIIGEETSSEETIDMAKNLAEILEMIAAERAVIDFLSSNKGQWEVQSDSIAFFDDALLEQYNQLLLQVQ